MKMTLKDFMLKITNANVQLRATDNIKIEFHAIDRDGMHIKLDSVDKIVYDVLEPDKIVIHLS